VNAVWIVLGIGAVAVAMLMLTTLWRRRDQQSDLGNVSHQWIAEQRMEQGHDSQR
jgi:heme exporter protein D